MALQVYSLVSSVSYHHVVIGVASRFNFFSSLLFVILGLERLQRHLQADSRSQLLNIISSVLSHHEASGAAGLLDSVLSDSFRSAQARRLAYLQANRKFKFFFKTFLSRHF